MSMEVNNKVAADLLRKYGVLVDPLSLSEQALARLARRINYPRVPPEATLRVWSDQVLGEGESVRFFLPQQPRRNTRLYTTQHLSESADLLVDELCDRALAGLYASEPKAERGSPADLSNEVVQEEIESITAGARRGLNILHALLEESVDWEPVIAERIQALLVAHQGDDEVDTLDAMTELLGHLNVTIRAARRVLAQANAVSGEA